MIYLALLTALLIDALDFGGYGNATFENRMLRFHVKIENRVRLSFP